MFNGMNSSIMNNFTIVQELSSTPENTKCFSRIKDITSFDSKFRESLLALKDIWQIYVELTLRCLLRTTTTFCCDLRATTTTHYKLIRVPQNQWRIWGMASMARAMGATFIRGMQNCLGEIKVCVLQFLQPLFFTPFNHSTANLHRHSALI